MLFNSFSFLFVFLPLTMATFFILSHFKLIKLALSSLVLASIIFYSYWNYLNVPILLVSIIFNYLIAKQISKTHNKAIFICAILINLILLGYFKYMNFFLHGLNDVIGIGFPIRMIILPLGISFFTFTQIAYLVDTYQKDIPKYNLLTYGLFVTFFPHLIAGPILHHRNIIPQFLNNEIFKFDHKNAILGICILVVGLFKKVIIADSLSSTVAIIFNHSSQASLFEAWMGSLFYTMQLYFDFSGYSDMAIGLGLMFNIRLPINFNSPYKSLSVIEFWGRWHITLSDFLKNYLYIPLGGNRFGQIRRFTNLFITMLLGGLWHGAGWTFILWGGLHGIFLIINHGWRRIGYQIPRFLSWVITFISVIIGWVFFRASSLNNAINLLRGMSGLNGIQFTGFSLINIGVKEITIIIILIIIVKYLPNTQQLFEYTSDSNKQDLSKLTTKFYIPFILGYIFFVIIKSLATAESSEFLYFMF